MPFTTFCEYDTRPGQERTPVWFALSEDRPLGFFAGIWTRWSSVRKLKEGETTNDLFGFLTTDANAVVAPIHPKAMPVILTEPEEIEHWLTAPFAEACRLQRPLSDDRLRIVARGAREDWGRGTLKRCLSSDCLPDTLRYDQIEGSDTVQRLINAAFRPR